MILEYAPYGSFTDVIQQQDLKMNIRIMKDVINGIYYLHSNGIIHRDLKSDNVLIVNNNINADICGKLTDFGSARVISMIQTNRTFTNGIGTPVYMAPEILNGQKYSLPSDIFSFAIILYESHLFTKPYQDKNKFKYSWDVPQFIQKGERLPRLDNMSDLIWEIIELSWKQEANDRLTIQEIKDMFACL